MSTIGSITIEMAANVARLQSDMEQAKRVVGDSMQSIEQAVSLAKQAFIAFAGVASIDALVGMINGVIKARAELKSLSEEAGMSVAALQQFKSIGALTETSITSIAAASEKLSKSFAMANEDSKGAAQAIQALGINFDAFKRMTPDQQMLEVAKAMNQFEDGSAKSAAAMLLFGKSGAQLLPFLKDLAENADKVNAKLTDQEKAAKEAAAAMSRDYLETLAKIRKDSNAWKTDLADGLLPAMYEAVKAFQQMTGGAGGVKETISQLAKDGTLADWARGAMTALSYLVDIVQALLSIIPMVGKAIAGVVAAGAEMFGSLSAAWQKLMPNGAMTNVFDMDFSGAWDSLKSGFAAVKTIGVETATDISNIWNQKLIGQTFRDTMESLKGVQAETNKAGLSNEELAKRLAAAAAAAAAQKEATDKQAKAYADLVASINEKIAAGEQEIAGGQKLTESQKLLNDIQKLVEKGTISLKDATSDGTKALIEKLAAVERDKAAAAEQLAILTQLTSMRQAEAKALADATAKVDDAIAKQNEENAAIGKTKEQLADLKARREEHKAALIDQRIEELMAVGALGNEYDSLVALRQKYLDLAQTMRDGARAQAVVDENKKIEDEYKRMSDNIEKSLTDSLMRGFESGKGFLQSFIDSAKNLFKSLVLQPVIKAIVQPVAAGVTGMLGLSGGASAATGGSDGAGGALSTLGSLSSLGSMFGAGGLSGALSAGAGWVTGSSTFLGNLSAAGSLIGTEGGMMAGLAMGAGTLMPLVGAALLINSLIGGKGGGPKTGGESVMDLLGGVSSQNTGGRQLYTPNGADSQVSSVVQSLTSDLASTARLLGGVATNMTVGLGYDTDPQGTAPNRVSSFLKVGGQSVYSATNKDFGRDDKALQQGMTDEASILMLAGLQHSNLSQQFADFFSKIDVAGATGATARAMIEMATNASKMATAVQDAGGIFSRLGTASVEARTAILQLTGGLDAFTQKAASFVRNYYTADEQAAISAAGIVRALGAAGITGQAATLATKDDFRALIDSLDLSTSAGVTQFAALLNVQESFASVAQYLKDNNTNLTALATLAPGGAALDALLGNNDAATQTAANTATQIDILGMILASIDKMAADARATATATVAALNTIATAADNGGFLNDVGIVPG